MNGIEKGSKYVKFSRSCLASILLDLIIAMICKILVRGSGCDLVVKNVSVKI